MPRIPALDPALAPDASKPLLDAVNQSLGLTPNLFKVAAHSPAALEGLLNLNGALGKGKLNASTREAIALAVAETNGCDYCLSAHTVLGAGAGLSDRDIADARSATAADPKLGAILEFARSLVLNRGHASDDQVTSLRAAGISDGEILEIIGNTVVNIFTNYINNVARTEVDFPLVQAKVPLAA